MQNHSGGDCKLMLGIVTLSPKLQALVYDIHPSTTAVFSYAIGSRKLSANEQFFVGAQSKFVTNNSDKTRRVIYSRQQSLHLHFFFLPGVDASPVYVRALALGYFYTHISTRTFRRALTASLDSCTEMKNAPSVA